jgi:hypothetical protein
MMPLSLRTLSATHGSSITLLLMLAVAALQSSTVLGMTIPFSNYGKTQSENMQNHGGNHQWHETASGIPTTGADWVTLPNGQEFQPATFDVSDHPDPADREKLVRAQRRFLGYRDNFVDGTETFYSERSQAWRMLGVYIDCDAQNNEGGDDHKDRKLKAGGLKQQTEEEDSNRKLEDVQQCQRYMLWAGVSQIKWKLVVAEMNACMNESNGIVVICTANRISLATLNAHVWLLTHTLYSLSP